MSKKSGFDKNKEEDGWHSEPHINHVTQTKKESIFSEIIDFEFNENINLQWGR